MYFKTYDRLISHIEADLASQDIRIYRFVNIDSLELWTKLKNYLQDKCQNMIRLSNYCYGEDLTPSIDELCADLRLIDNNTLLVPLSEHLRINYLNSESVFKRIIDIQFLKDVYTEGIHLYVLLYSMKGPLQNLSRYDPRLEKNIFYLDTFHQETPYSLTIASTDLAYYKMPGLNIIGYKNYLSHWEVSPIGSVVLYTRSAKYFENSVIAELVKIFISPFDVISKNNLMPFKIEMLNGEDWQWHELLKRSEVRFTETSFKENFFGSKNINEVQILADWPTGGEFDKWIIWIWLKNKSRNNYISYVTQQNESYKTFINDLVCSIFDFPIQNQSQYLDIYLERKIILEHLGLDELPSQFWSILCNQNNEVMLYYLTDTTKIEREKIISLLGEVAYSERISQFLKYAYPNLHLYLGHYEFGDQRYTDYFSQYKKNKVENRFNKEFLAKVSSFAEEKGIWWDQKARNAYINEYYNDNSYILWVDALGVEYLAFIQGLLENKHKGIYNIIEVGYSNIPTVTELNKDFVTDRNYDCIRDLDELKHKGVYPNCIESELAIIEKALSSAINKLDIYERVIIASDHGSSRGAILCRGESKKAGREVKVERFGRYCTDADVSYEELYSGCIVKEDTAIFANYDRFSIGGNEKSEIHGGATLEEVLVPIIVLSKEPLEDKAHIIVLQDEVKLKPGMPAKIRFTIDKEYEELYAIVDAQKYVCKRTPDYWYFEPNVGDKADYKAKITSKGTVGELAYRIIKGRTDSEKFNI